MANIKEFVREMALNQCRQNASATTKSELNMSGSSTAANLMCDQAVEMLGWMIAAELDVLSNRAVAAVVVALYVVVIIVGTLGSLLVFVSVVSTRQMWTATNVFIANLALTDLVVCAFDLPLTLHYQVCCTMSYTTPHTI